MDDVITLVSYTYEKDAYGVPQKTETTRDVFAKVQSVSRQEFFEGGRNGLNPSFVFSVFAGDYNGETVCKYNGLQYAIYRTYSQNGSERTSISNTGGKTTTRSYHVPGSDYIELYVERKGGTNGSTS